LLLLVAVEVDLTVAAVAVREDIVLLSQDKVVVVEEVLSQH
jgi:hypothetical protein